MFHLDGLHWQMALRGAVAALLLLHLLQLALPGPRPAARLALGGFVASVLAYVFCQRPQMLLEMPRPLAITLLVMCVGSAAWMWAAARALFDDGFQFGPRVATGIAVLVAVGLAVNLPYFPDGDGPYRAFPPESWVVRLAPAHAIGMLAFSAAALWEVARGWHDDLVATRRAARRWVAMGVGAYSALALVVELALQGREVGPLLPALHLAGIGGVALALALWVMRHSLTDLLGVPPPPPQPPAITAPEAPCTVALPDKTRRALARLASAMAVEQMFRQEGLTLATLARHLDIGEAALRELINQHLGFRNFNDFLHHHRLQEAAARLASEDLPILSIALGCGYGSIGPFNRAFKQRHGVTPTEFRVRARISRV